MAPRESYVMIEIGAVASEQTNLTLRDITAPAQKDSDGVPEIEMSFADFLDMINPLQHIPVLSSVVRAVTGDEISPAARVAGDALYGGIFGVASAGVGALGALGDEAVAALNDGQSASEFLVAALSGNEKAQDIQVADASTETKKTETAVVAPVAPQEASPPETTVAAAETTPREKVTLAKTKLPFGGVMETPVALSARGNTAVANAGQLEILQAQRALRNNRFAVATPSTTTSPVADTASATLAAATANMEPETQSAMQQLLDELRAMKAINQYQNAAENTPLPGESVNIVN